MKSILTTSTAAAGVSLQLLAASVAADEATPAGWHGGIGLGAEMRPAYEGAKDKTTRLTPNVDLRYGDTLFFAGRAAGANLLQFTTTQGGVVTAGPLLALRRSRDEGDSAALTGLGNIDRSLDAGGFVRLRLNHWQAGVDVRKAVANGDGGATVNFSAGYDASISRQLRLRANLDASWASAAYMHTFFGIDAAQSANSGIPQYQAGAGFKHVGIGFMANYAIDRDWGGFAALRYKRLVGDAAASPIVANLGSSGQAIASVGIQYRF
ncbi:MAG: MipA/OmpV family protein [Betaproteobacteria bacterium]|nr:MipA/OmpV family protein [Betaproteobacteria bacterium]